MGCLINGEWYNEWVGTTSSDGEFVRKDSCFRHWIKADGSTDFLPEPNRYHIYVSYACPWANRTLIFRKLKKLEAIISYSSVDALMLDNGWEFGKKELRKDPLYQKNYLYEIYLMADANYSGRVTVPILWDKKTKTIVNNESSEIIRMLNSEFNEFTNVTDDYYPKTLRPEIDALNDQIYHSINNGVYKCGFATKKIAYEETFDALFDTLEELNNRLENQAYLINNTMTEADWRLFVTLIRFDAVYVGHFKCNKKRIFDYPHLHRYLIKLYNYPGIKETVHMDDIKQHYYGSHLALNPTGIVPKGPDLNLEKY